MIDLKMIQSVLEQLEEERGIAKEKIIEAIEEAFAHAYKKEYGKRSQIVKARVDIKTGEVSFEQIKVVVDETTVYTDDEPRPAAEETDEDGGDEEKDERERFDAERHIFIDDARKMKSGVELGDELSFPLDTKEDFGRIAAQTAKQVMIQKIREAEKAHLSKEFSKREGDIVTGSVQRIERGNIYVDLGRATGLLPYEEQIPGERYRQGERIRAYLYSVEETPRGIFLRLSRSHPDFLEKLFALESPEVAGGTVEIRAIAREAGSRSKVAVWSNDEHVDPVGSLVGQRGVRVSTVMSELGGEKIDIVEYSDDPTEFIEEALSPAAVVDVEVISDEEDNQQATVRVAEDQQSLAIGRGGQNVRLAAKLTGWRIDIQSVGGETVAEADEEGEVEVKEEEEEVTPEQDEPETEEVVEAPTSPDDESESRPESVGEKESESEEESEEKSEEEESEKDSAEEEEEKE